MAADEIVLETDFTEPASITALSTVGTVYDIAIDGTGYILAETAEGEGYEKTTIPLIPDRLATGDTPFDQAVERYSFGSGDSWVGGQGQTFLNRQDSDSTMFLSSEGLDPFSEPGSIKLLPSTPEMFNTTFATPRLVVVGTTLYVQTAADQLTHFTDVGTPGAGTAIDHEHGGAAVTITDLTTDGQYWYAACGTKGILRGTTSAITTQWDAAVAHTISYAAGRICAGVIANSSTTPNRFTTYSIGGAGDTGTEERSGGHLTLGKGWTVGSFAEANGHIYFCAHKGNRGMVYAWPLGLDSSGNTQYPFVAWDMPPGLSPREVFAAGGSIFVRAYRQSTGSTGTAYIYRGVPDPQTGALTPFFITELADKATTDDHVVGEFTARDNQVFWGWKKMTSGDKTGLGCYDLETGGYVKFFESDDATAGDVYGADVWQGRVVYSVGGTGVKKESTTAFLKDGTLIGSRIDGGSALAKGWDEIIVLTTPMGAAVGPDICAVTPYVSTNEGTDYTTLSTLDTETGTSQSTRLSSSSRSLQYKIVFEGSGASTTTLNFVQVKYHAIGLRDTVVSIVVDCGDSVRGLNGHPLPENAPGAGTLRARTLAALTQRRVNYQDIDWPITKAAEVYEVLQVQTRALGVYDRSQALKRHRLLATVVLRKAD
ncbi:MAG: hypothetical protein QF565_09035 [Arenicellales bacterium]|jgi:hypothetical protein|nr:hypothetical protein [Arenicellales bacterium]|tara:strand:- start:10445 stop:12409 length:1965 start_codon:yes stop_codon:yes gene_type:complete